MAQDHNDIYTIVEKLAILEGRITPTGVKKGLNPQQRSVPQMPALFKPKTQKILGGNPNAKNPMSGYMVGSDESAEPEQAMLEADMAEDVLAKVQKSFKDFIKQAEEQIKDTDLKDKPQEDTDLKSRDQKDRGLRAKDHPSRHLRDPEDDQQDLPSDRAYERGESPYDAPERQTEESELGSALSGVIPAEQPAGEPGVSMKESMAVKTVQNEYGVYEMHGNERDGFEIRRAGRSMPTRFRNLDEAEMAIEMFAARRRKQDESQDYLDEE